MAFPSLSYSLVHARPHSGLLSLLYPLFALVLAFSLAHVPAQGLRSPSSLFMIVFAPAWSSVVALVLSSFCSLSSLCPLLLLPLGHRSSRCPPSLLCPPSFLRPRLSLVSPVHLSTLAGPPLPVHVKFALVVLLLASPLLGSHYSSLTGACTHLQFFLAPSFAFFNHRYSGLLTSYLIPVHNSSLSRPGSLIVWFFQVHVHSAFNYTGPDPGYPDPNLRMSSAFFSSGILLEITVIRLPDGSNK